MDPEQNNQDTNDGEKNGEVVDLTGWNVEEKDDKDKHDTDDENESMVRKNIFHFYYNLIHSLKMVIVKPYLDTVQENDVYRHWVKMSTSYDITKKKNGKSEAIFYYNTTAKGDGAFLDLKTNIEDKDVKVFHPHAELKQKIGKYWECLKTLCSIGKAPVNPDIGEKIFSRLIIIEKVPESVTEDELIERFPEAINVLCFPHIKGTKGLRILEFENETTAMKFLREHKDEEIDGASVRMTKYGRRASEWDEKNNKEKYTTCILPDDDRIEKCKRMIEIVTKLTELNNREDIFGEEKVVEFQQLYEEKLLLSDQLKSDTDYRKLKKMSFPEDEDIRTSYTQFAEKKEWDRSSRAKKAAIAYGIEKESRKSSHKTRSVSPVGKDKEKDDKNKCFNCGGKGHFARDCPSEKEGVDCYNCGKSGHFARDCRLPSNKKGGPGGRRRSRSPPYEAPHSKRRARSRDRRDSERDRFGFRSRSPVYRDDRRGGKRQTSPMVLGRGSYGDHGLECFKCGNGGHYARDCPGMMDIKKGGDGCYKCGMSGHFARDCTDYGSQPAKSGKCYNCGGDGHMARECSMQQQDSKPRKPCFNCGEDGHMARDCPMPQQDSKQRKACFNCGGDGHMARDCPMQQQDSSQRKSCYNCRENGHLARDCPHQDQVKQNETCFKCGGTGHYSRDCSSSDAGNRARSDKCYMCKGEGHFARDCPNRTAGTGSSGGGSGRDVSDSYRRDSMSDQADQWRSSGMDDRSMGNSSHNSGSMAVQGNVHSYGDTNMGAFGDAGGGLNASSELVANVMRMAGVTNARPTEVAAILQNISQSLSSSVSRLERADVDSRVGRY